MIDIQLYRQRISCSPALIDLIVKRKRATKKQKVRRQYRRQPRKNIFKKRRKNTTSRHTISGMSDDIYMREHIKVCTYHLQHILVNVLFWILSVQTIYCLLMMSGIEPNPGPSYGDEFIRKSIRVCGHSHQGNITETPHNVYRCVCVPNSYSQGVQCVCNSITAVALRQLKDIHMWQSDDIDVILCSGDRFYKAISSEPRYLEMSDIPSKVHILEEDFYIVQHAPMVTEVKAALIRPALDKLLTHQCIDGILLMGNRSGAYASSIHCHNDSFYIFDPHARSGTTGYPHPDGKSIVIHFEDSISCALYLKNIGYQLQAEQLNICPIEMIRIAEVSSISK